ncbi:MAG: PAS domain S-box protein, partial [Gammaproteobacteria bacterium]|nr:PAS domain S-box protein [Gammaproteobacteria bacterium]
MQKEIKSRKHLIAELTRSNTLFNQAENMGKLGYWEWDVLKDRLVDCSEQYAEIFETTKKKALKLNYEDDIFQNIDSIESFTNKVNTFIHEKDRERYIHVTETAYQNKEPWSIEFRFVTANGCIVHLLEVGEPVLDENGTLIRTFGIIQDITDYKQNEEKLAIQDNILNNISDGASLIRISDGTILYTNPAFELMFGYEQNEMLGKPFSIIFAPTTEFSQQEVAQYSQAELLKAKSMKGEFRKIKKNGTIILTSSSITTFNHPEHGDVWVAISVDITEQRENEKLLQRTQKLDALGKLTGGIAHDFNNLLGVIMGYSELLHFKLVKKPNSTNYNKQILRAAQRGAKLTKRLLSFTSKQLFEAKKTNINTLIFQLEDMLQKTLTIRISLVLELSDKIWPLMLDESQLEDAILNMCINAMHAIDIENAESKVTICTMNQVISESEAQLLGINAGDYVLISLTDTGCGIDSKIIDQIFDPFFSTKGDMGTGLGLSQTFGFV